MILTQQHLIILSINQNVIRTELQQARTLTTRTKFQQNENLCNSYHTYEN